MSEPTAAAGAATQQVSIGPMQVMDLAGFTYFYVTKRTTMEAMKADIEQMMPKVAQACEAGPVRGAGPYLFCYIMDGDLATFEMRVGFRVSEGTAPCGEAQVADLGEFRCAALLVTGPLQSIHPGWQALMAAVQSQGLMATAEAREWYLYWEGDDSPNNVMWLQEGVRP